MVSRASQRICSAGVREGAPVLAPVLVLFPILEPLRLSVPLLLWPLWSSLVAVVRG